MQCPKTPNRLSLASRLRKPAAFGANRVGSSGCSVTSRRSSKSHCSSICSYSPEINEARFTEAARKGNVIPLYKCIFSDHLTPVLAYRCLVKEDDREAPSFIFESVEPGLVAIVGRYSVVGAQPAMEIVAKENNVKILEHLKGGRLTEKIVEDPTAIPRAISESWSPQLMTGLPDTFSGEKFF